MDDPILWTPWRMPYLRGEDRKNYDGCVFCVKGKGADVKTHAGADFDAREYIVARQEHVYVALNMYPYNNGHLLVIPYAHVPSLEALPADALADLMLGVTRSLAALRTVYNPQAFNIGANIGAGAGAGIPEHFHFHIVPRWEADTGYMTVIGGARMVPDMLQSTWARLREVWDTGD
ncbi:MAG: HIT domain-containing protein [Anaerolineae bacterium]|nr:HIT domain-containing protein [Anaerolineae bacterium]